MPLSIKELLESGAHFGHQTRRWNPKMRPFIFIERNGIHIIDLQKTVACAERAYAAVKAAAQRGEPVLFVGTKKQAKSVVEEAATRCGQHYVTERWLGGMLTNFATIRKSLARYKELQKLADEGGLEQLGKKERNRLVKEKNRMEKMLLGIVNLDRLPGVLYVIDTKKEEIAVKEARKLGIPIVGVVDTNADPDLIDFPVPGNDDAIRAIRLFTDHVAAAVLAGRERELEGRDIVPSEPGRPAQVPAAAEPETAAPWKEPEEEVDQTAARFAARFATRADDDPN